MGKWGLKMTNKLIRNLKTLFHTFINYKEDDEPNFHQRMHENITYTNGEYVNKSTKEQTVTVSFSAEYIAPGYRIGDLKINVNPGVAGQSVVIQYVRTSNGAITTTTLTTNSNGYCYLTDSFFRNYDATVIIQPITVNGVSYSGGTATYRL